MTETAPTLVDEALRRISVRPPYFGLREIEHVAPGVVRAPIDPAHPTNPEVGAIEAGQAARHLAILGSCAAALAREDDKRNHYLAMQAHYVRCSASPSTPVTEPLVAEAVATWLDKRSVRALTKLSTESGQGLVIIDLTYAVLAPKMFHRFNHLPDTALPIPVTQTSLLDAPVTETPEGVQMVCGPIPTSVCDGHFPDFPAAPVAVVMQTLCRTAGFALAKELDVEPGFIIEEGHVEATKLAVAGQQLVLDASYVKAVGDKHHMRGTARADGDVVGEVQVTMSVPPAS